MSHSQKSFLVQKLRLKSFVELRKNLKLNLNKNHNNKEITPQNYLISPLVLVCFQLLKSLFQEIKLKNPTFHS